MINKQNIGIFISILLILSIGFVSGLSVGYFKAYKNAFPKFKESIDVNPKISTIKFLKLEHGIIKGEISGRKTRIAYSPEAIFDLEENESFEIPIYKINLSQFYSARDLPEGVQYIASKHGKYYYHIMNPRSLKITPKNRVYFKKSDEAEKRGYIPVK